MKKEECQFQVIQELDLSTSTNIPTKSTSKEYAQLLEVEPSVEQLEDMLHSKKLQSWKQVAGMVAGYAQITRGTLFGTFKASS